MLRAGRPTMTRYGFRITASLIALAAASPGYAQDRRSEESEGDIIVTAQKRTENVRDVPLSSSVVSGEALERQQAVTFQDYAKLIPGLQLEQSNPGEARLVLRGINTGGVAST